MCTNGVNTGQFKTMMEQIDDHIALERRWMHRLYHSADDAGFAGTAAALKEAQSLLDDARALLTDAQDALDKDAENASNVTVNLV